MGKYIVRPGQRVNHGSLAEAQTHFAKMVPGQTLASFPPAPVHVYEEGDEIELTEDEALDMPHAVCSPDEFASLSSPVAFQKKGYTKDEAESMAASLKDSMDERAKGRKALKTRRALPGGGFAPTDGATEVDPRTAGKFPDDAVNKRK